MNVNTINRTINGQPAAIPIMGFVYRGYFHGRAVTPRGWVPVRIALLDFYRMLQA